MIARDACRIIRETIHGAGLPAPFANLLLIPLSQPGKILHDEDSAGWLNLVRATAAAVHAPEQASARILAALEVNAAALDVFDEIEDGDASPLVEQIGVAQSLNVATALLFLAQIILGKLAGDSSTALKAADFGSTLARFGLTATSGQHRDLEMTATPTSSYDEALMITQSKSGSLAACAVRLTAQIGTDDSEILDLYEDFGRHYGTMVQLANDIHDAQRNDEKSDLALLKPTLPVIYFLRGLEHSQPETLTPEALANSGALQFAWVVFERKRQTCNQILDLLADHDQETTELRRLVE